MPQLRRSARVFAGLAAVLGVLSGVPSRAEYLVETYASIPDTPMQLAFGPLGALYVGTQAAPGAQTDDSWVYRVAPGGASVATHGNRRIGDPDAVYFDATGALSGQAGTVIVGGFAPWNGVQTRGALSFIRPGGAIDQFIRPSFHNPVQFATDSAGRLLFTDQSGDIPGIYAAQLGVSPPTRIAPVPFGNRAFGLAVGAGDLLYSSFADGVVRVFNPDGTLLDPAFATIYDPAGMPGTGRQTALAFAPGGAFGTDLYATTAYAGQVLRIDPSGNTRVVLSGLGAITGLAFGPDGAMYLSDATNGRILRVTPVPEPAALLLVGLGGLAIVGVRLRGRGSPEVAR